VPLDRARADEQEGADLRVRVAVGRQLRDLGFLRGEFVAGLDTALADGLTGRRQLAPGALGERIGSDRRQYLVRGP
jgi:hypothetical protein